MPKILRTNDLFSGSCGRVFESDLFKVHYCQDVDVTRLKCSSIKAKFKGEHALTSDALCIEQLTPEEIVKIITYQQEINLIKGRQEKVREIKKCLDLQTFAEL